MCVVYTSCVAASRMDGMATHTLHLKTFPHENPPTLTLRRTSVFLNSLLLRMIHAACDGNRGACMLDSPGTDVMRRI